MDEGELWAAHRNLPTSEEKGKLREPAQAIAMAKCICFRLGFKTRDRGRWFHTDDCTYCKFPLERLTPIYEEWMQWSGLNDPENRHPTLEMFESLPVEIQAQEVRKAQGYVRQIHQASDSDQRPEHDPAQGVAEDGRQAGGPERRGDIGGAAQARAANRASRGVRREQPEGAGSDPSTGQKDSGRIETTPHSGAW